VIVSLGLAVSFLAGPARTTILPGVDPEQLEDIRDYTSTAGSTWIPHWPAVLSAPGTEAVLAESPERIGLGLTVRALHQLSGLTWDQLGKLFGVSRRAVHHWAAGGRMTARNAELLSELTRIVQQLEAADPASRRAILLTPGDDGYSMFDRIRSHQATSREDVSAPPFAPDELLGAVTKDE
jgi:hypothetical protein